MIFDETSTALGLLVMSAPAVLAAYFHFIKDNHKIALLLLLASAFLLRLLMISLDPYLHEWDERVHALVAKHIISDPFKPMLILQHILPFDKNDVSYTDIWVHKQPVFLWQMAVSMKLFGVNLIAMRLPSAIMGTLIVWMTYDLCKKWWQDTNVAFIGAYLSCFAYYALELTSGYASLDHNDLAFTFYMACCFWAFTRYISDKYPFKWAALIGVFAGMAILNKWLTGILIFGGWGLFLLMSEKFELKKYLHLWIAILFTCAIFLPWQIYISERFPLEAGIAYGYNHRHISEDLGHPGNVWFHLRYLHVTYHLVLMPFLLMGIIAALVTKKSGIKISISFLAMIVALFGFFSIFVMTKMPAFVYPVSILIFGFMAVGIDSIIVFITGRLRSRPFFKKIVYLLIILFAGLWSLKPWQIAHERSEANTTRTKKIHNTAIFKDLNVPEGHIVLNTRTYENLELMFFKDVLAYHYYPTEHRMDSLQNLGYKFAAFDYPDEIQELPDYIVNDKSIVILPELLK